MCERDIEETHTLGGACAHGHVFEEPTRGHEDGYMRCPECGSIDIMCDMLVPETLLDE